MEQGILGRITPLGIAFGLVLGSVAGAAAAERQATRTYSYVAPAYDDVPGPLDGVAIQRRSYGYRPDAQRWRVYNYTAPAPVARRPVYGYVATPTEAVVVERENRPLGVYAPESRENLSEPRRYFRAITRQSGGD